MVGTMVSEICLTKLNVLADGLDAESVLHEDLHDPGDASGVHLHVREREGRLSVELATWEDPSSRTQFFTLERSPGAASRPGMPCP